MSETDGATFRTAFEDSIIVQKMLSIALGFFIERLPRRWSGLLCQLGFLTGIGGIYLGARQESFYWWIFFSSTIWGMFLSESLNSGLWVMRHFSFKTRRIIPVLLNSAADFALMVPEVFRSLSERGILSYNYCLLPLVLISAIMSAGIFKVYPDVVHDMTMEEEQEKGPCCCEAIQKDQDIKEAFCCFCNPVCACPTPCKADPCRTVQENGLKQHGSYGTQVSNLEAGDLEHRSSFHQGRDGGDMKLTNLTYPSFELERVDPVRPTSIWDKILTGDYLVATICFATAFVTKLNVINYEQLKFSLVAGADEAFISSWTTHSALLVATIGTPIAICYSGLIVVVPIFWIFGLVHASMIGTLMCSVQALNFPAESAWNSRYLYAAAMFYCLAKGVIVSGLYVSLTSTFGITGISRLVSICYIALIVHTKFVSLLLMKNMDTVAGYQASFMRLAVLHVFVLVGTVLTALRGRGRPTRVMK